jgi:hypothetical protein
VEDGRVPCSSHSGVLDNPVGVIEDAVVSRGGTWVRSQCGSGIWGDPGPLSTLGTVRRPLQTVLQAPDSAPAGSGASAYAFQGARVPQRFCRSQMFQRSVKSFLAGLDRVVHATRVLWGTLQEYVPCNSG